MGWRVVTFGVVQYFINYTGKRFDRKLRCERVRERRAEREGGMEKGVAKEGEGGGRKNDI